MTTKKKDSATGEGEPAGTLITCEPCLEIAQAEALLEQVRAALEQPDVVRVNAASVDTITTPCVQVFCALALALQSRGQQIAWEAPSAKLLDVANVLGVRDALGLTTEAG